MIEVTLFVAVGGRLAAPAAKAILRKTEVTACIQLAGDGP